MRILTFLHWSVAYTANSPRPRYPIIVLSSVHILWLILTHLAPLSTQIPQLHLPKAGLNHIIHNDTLLKAKAESLKSAFAFRSCWITVLIQQELSWTFEKTKQKEKPVSYFSDSTGLTWSLNVKASDSMIRQEKRLNKYGRVRSKKNMAAQLRFAKLHLNKPQDFWNNVLWTDQTKVEMRDHNVQHHVWWSWSLCCHLSPHHCH